MITFAIVYFAIGFSIIGTVICIGIMHEGYDEVILSKLRFKTRIESIVWVFKVILRIIGAIIGWPYFLIVCIEDTIEYVRVHKK